MTGTMIQKKKPDVYFSVLKPELLQHNIILRAGVVEGVKEIGVVPLREKV